MNLKTTFCVLIALFSSIALAEKPTIKFGALAFGTVNWELAVMSNENLLDGADFDLEIIPIANPQAGKIALQADAVDMIVSDWIWVSRMRASGADYTFYPYSNTSGALLVAQDSPVDKIADLPGKKLGIAGGELDKNWLLLQALALQQKIDLNNTVDKVYGAPPLLNQQLRQRRIDAVINYWHFAARLEAQGYRQIIDGQEILQQLDIKVSVPSLGYVFRRTWGERHKGAVDNFLQLTATAKDRLCHSDASWEKIATLTKAKDEAMEKNLRRRYCDGRVRQWGPAQRSAAEKIYRLLHELSNNKLTGSSAQLQSGTFWGLD